MEIKKVLSIAGSDPSGGAGIQADLKTFSALGVYGAAVITGLTVQNTQKVKDALLMPGDFVRQQTEAVLEDIDISFIKIGMLGNAEIAKSVGECLEEWMRKPAPVRKGIVCDPVMISKSGYPLMKEDAMRAVLDYVVSVSTVLTPNRHELEKISEFTGGSAEAVLDRFEHLQAILVKGGHMDEKSESAVDTLVMRHGDRYRSLAFSHKRFDTKNTHGTGCTLSSAIAAYLARGMEIPEAVESAVNFVQKLIGFSAEHAIGQGNGPLIHFIGE